jgi:hypothetical protein
VQPGAVYNDRYGVSVNRSLSDQVRWKGGLSSAR